MDKIILYRKKVSKYIVECIKNNYDENITKFVAQTYYNKPHFRFSDKFNKILEVMLEEDKLFKDYSMSITVYDENNEIQGTIRKIYAENGVVLPVEREFNIELLNIIKENVPINNVCEIARFANKSNDIRALKILLTELVASSNKYDLFLASLDSKVLSGVRKLGFAWYDIGKSKEYLGSLTCPVAVSVNKITGVFSYERTSRECNRFSVNDKY